jgi:hypothetical protein
MRRRWLAALAGLGLALALVHALAARALIDQGVAGALLAGGGSWSTVAAAAGFLLLRLACFVALAAVPAVLVWRSRMVWRQRSSGREHASG